MKKRILIGLVVVLAVAATAAVVWAEDPVEYTDNVPKDSHKVKNKWDLSGTFVAYPGYNWGGLAEGATWTYRIHIKEAMDGQYSVGSIHFVTGDVDVVGNVKATQRPYPYWSGDTLGACGTANYNEVTYYFMFLMKDTSMWFALSTTPYDTYWPTTVWGSGLRAYQLHSLNIPGQFPLDYKVIHGIE